MRRLSVKTRMTLWFTGMMAAVAALVLALLLVVSSTVVSRTAMENLSQTVRASLSEVKGEDGELRLSSGFQFYQNEVYLLVYSQQEALLAGQLPSFFTGIQEPFQNGVTRSVATGQGDSYVLDFWVPFGWETGVWVRGVTVAGEGAQTGRNVVVLAAVALPLLLVLAGAGGYLIARRAFRPLDQMAATASAISQGSDLSARIPVSKRDDEFSRLAGTFNQMLERLERSFQAEEQFAADASHELRTPVSVILGACEYAEKYDETPEERRETMEMIHRQSRRMSALISQLLSMTRMEQGTEAVRWEALDLAALARGLAQEPAFAGEPITQNLSPAEVTGDSQLLERLLRNLLENALRYGHRPGEEPQITVTTGRAGEEAFLTVADRGPGIPEEEQEKVWQRFYRGDPSRTGEEGTGLGLSLARQIAQLHGGSLTLESRPVRGAPSPCGFPRKNKKSSRISYSFHVSPVR